ncbi:MAG: hypothetical protein KF774_16205 [Planctomyces sp.]|nr:hypothetical protein [Planctomyces sp.]
MSDSSPVRYVTVVCRVCQSRLDERQDERPRRVKCPVCQTSVAVPAASETPPSPPVRLPDVEGYALADSATRAGAERLRKAADVVLVVCPICRARIHATPEKDAGQMSCPDCLEPVRIPSRTEARAAAAQSQPRRKAEVVEAVPLRPTSARRPREYSQWFLQAQSSIRRDPDPEPPKRLYLSDTFSIPWQREVRSRWLGLTLGLTALCVIGLLTLHLFEQASGAMGMALAFFALPMIWVAIWTLSYAAAVWLTILIDTANGCRTIISWGDQNWREWVLQLTYVQYLLAITLMLSHGVAWLVRLAGGAYAATFGVTAVLLFPVVVVSALERGGSWNFYSPGVLGSLFFRPGAWLGFWAISGALAGVVGLGLSWLMEQSLTAGLLVAGPTAAALVLMHARLLGRLAWASGR